MWSYLVATVSSLLWASIKVSASGLEPKLRYMHTEDQTEDLVVHFAAALMPALPGGSGLPSFRLSVGSHPDWSLRPSNKPQLREWRTEGPSLCPILYRVGPSPVIDLLPSGPGVVEGQQYVVSGPFRVRTPDVSQASC